MSPQQGAEAQGHPICLSDASGFYPWPRVVRTSAPVGQTPMLREWWTRAQLSAISALSPAGQLDFYGQERAFPSRDVVACLEPLRREVPGRLVIIGDGAPLHRRRTMREVRAHGAAQRRHVARLPASAPALQPGEGLWQPLNGLERRHRGCVEMPRLRRARRGAVKRGQRQPRMLNGGFQGAGLEIFMHGSVIPLPGLTALTMFTFYPFENVIESSRDRRPM